MLKVLPQHLLFHQLLWQSIREQTTQKRARAAAVKIVRPSCISFVVVHTRIKFHIVCANVLEESGILAHTSLRLLANAQVIKASLHTFCDCSVLVAVVSESQKKVPELKELFRAGERDGTPSGMHWQCSRESLLD